MPQNVQQILARLRSEPLIRTFTVNRKAIDEKARTVNLAFASDKPIDHWFGRLALSMTKGAMRKQRLQSGAPLLMDHNARDQVGVIEVIQVGADGIARATVRFGESARAKEIFHDVKTGIRQKVSVGFMIHEMHLVEKGSDGIDLYRSNSWEPYEISIVAVPADISVGVGRSKFNSHEENTAMAHLNDQPSPDLAGAAEVREWGNVLGERDSQMATAYLDACVRNNETPSKEGFFAVLRANKPPVQTIPSMDPGTQAERQGGISYQPAVSVPRHSVRNFTGEGAEDKAYRFGQWLLGGPCGISTARQWCMERGLLSRAMSEGSNEKGGYLVPEEFSNDLIVLVEKYGVFRRNAKVRPMSSDHRSDPILTSELESEFVGESQEGTDQDLTYSRVSLYARKQMILVPFSSELNEDSSLAIGDELAGASARAFAKKEDECGFNGDGTSPYGGMVGIRDQLKSVDANPANVAGLQVASGNAYSEIVLTDFEQVAGRLPEYADENAKWYVSKRFYWNVMVKLLLASGNGVTATEIEDARNRKFLGYPVEFVQVMPSAEANSQVCALLGDLSLGSLFGDRRSIRIKISDEALIRQDDFLFKATERFDVNSVFGVGDTTNAGPIVGLITAAS